MGNKVKGLTVSVALGDDVHEDYAHQIINAIRMINGVIAVEVAPNNGDEWFMRKKVKEELRDMILDWYKKL